MDASTPVKPTRVCFLTADPAVVTDMTSRTLKRREGAGFLYVPPGLEMGGKAPAVVIIEGLGGIKAHRELAYGSWLAANGFVALAVDSFSPRGLGQAPHNLRALKVTESTMLADAFAALRYLSGHPMIDPRAIGIMGFSYGGMITVLSAYDQIRRTFAQGGMRFAAHASYYGCSVPRLDDPTATGAPVHIHVGELDDNVSVGRSSLIADDLRSGGAPVDFSVHPGVYHQWDGDDVTLRHVPWALGDLEMTLDTRNRIRDRRTRLIVRGRASRALAVVAGARRAGYHVLRDAATTARVNAQTLDLFRDMAPHLAGAAQRIGPSAPSGRDRPPRSATG